MLKISERHFNLKNLGKKTLAAAAGGLLLTGMLMVPNRNPVPSSLAAPLTASEGSAGAATGSGSPFTVLAERLGPTVVNIKVTKVENTRFDRFQSPDGSDFFDRFFDHPQTPRGHRVQGAGSGVIIQNDGVIVTNNHVVEGAREVTVTLADKSEYQAQVVGRDPKTDLAVLKVQGGRELPAATMGDSEKMRVGDWVVAIGNPFGLGHTVTSGIVSAKGRVIGAGPYDDFIQTDASINPGNSGGPLFNMDGEVIGINTAIVPQGQGIGFAIPINTVRPLIPQLVEKGEVTRGYMGVNIQPVTADLAKAMNLGAQKGALVADVVAGGPAEKAGIRRGDVIVAFNGKGVDESHALPALVAASPVGKEAAVTILRDGKEHQLTVTIARMPGDSAKAEQPGQPSQGKWGLSLRDLDPQSAQKLGLKTDKGVLVAGVLPGSPAEEAAIKQGEVILEVNRKPVGSIEELKAEIARAGDSASLVLLVQGEKGTRYVVLKG